MKKRHLILSAFLLVISTITIAQTGNASYYSNNLKGRKTSDGSRYHPDSMTCAHKSLPFGTLLLVTNPKNGNRVILKVTDRGPHSRNRLIDVSYGAARELDIISAGIAKVVIKQIDLLPEKIRLIPIPKVYIPVSPLRFLKQELQLQIQQAGRV